VKVAPRSEATNALRRRIKNGIEDEIMDFFLVQGGQVVIYDANNGNVKARKETLDKFEAKGVHVIFLGSCYETENAYYQRVSVIKRISSLLISVLSNSPRLM
jgi:6-phosphofructo-2-kinase/fructose-2,6-biphosphatase 4